jgi:hypothetical protein
MNAGQTKKEILQSGSQQGKDVSLRHYLVAVSNNSGYNVTSYSDDAQAQAENHALRAGDAFSRSQPMPNIYLITTEPRVKGLWELKVVDGKSKLEWTA